MSIRDVTAEVLQESFGEGFVVREKRDLYDNAREFSVFKTESLEEPVAYYYVVQSPTATGPILLARRDRLETEEAIQAAARGESPN